MIRRVFGIGRLNRHWKLPSRLVDNPPVWKVEGNGMLVDIRQETRERQEAAFRNGLIPYIPADQTKTKDDQASKPSPNLHSVEGNLFSTLLDFHKRVSPRKQAPESP